MSESRFSFFVPDAVPRDVALARTTHLAIGAHPDDLELIGIQGIFACHENERQWFSGIVVTDGGGSARNGKFARLSNDEMVSVRHQEQIEAAQLGQFSVVVQLGLQSANLINGFDEALIDQIATLLLEARPDIVYLHNPGDRHATHVAVCVHAIEALRRLDTSCLPKSVYGIEVWRSLDWVSDAMRISLDVSGSAQLQQRLLAAHRSQVEGGKRYDLAVQGRYVANATFNVEREVDSYLESQTALDLLPLIRDPGLSVQVYTEALVKGLSAEIVANLAQFNDT